MKTNAELETALADYRRARDQSSQTGDWSIWANVFAEDAHYIEHAYGELQGRAAIQKWITEVMAPFPHMTFPQDWVVLDPERGAVLFQCQNRFPDPPGYTGPPFQFPNWTRLVLGEQGLWQSEEDVYNPARDAPRVFQQWTEAGGKVLTAEQVGMVHR